jgi:hypothetical protein
MFEPAIQRGGFRISNFETAALKNAVLPDFIRRLCLKSCAKFVDRFP